ncbi:MAG: FkbM family methyltransferase [Kiritimatiellia bacterium]
MRENKNDIFITCDPPTNAVPLGKVTEFKITNPRDGEFRFLLAHEGLRYLRPLKDWSPESNVTVFPQAPGRYRIEIHHRSENGHEWSSVTFEVQSSQDSKSTHEKQEPSLHRLGKNWNIWSPGTWEAQHMAMAEDVLRDVVRRELKPGDVTYDIGANVGMYATLMSREIGKKGHLVAIEANPLCISYLQTNLSLNSCFDNYTILPVAVSERCELIPFTIDYGNSNLATLQGTEAFNWKTGHEILVHAEPLDNLIFENGLRYPDFIKLDIEGAEAMALRGMQKILSDHKPTLFIELHGLNAAVHSLHILEELAYAVESAESGATFPSSDTLAATGRDEIYHVVARGR